MKTILVTGGAGFIGSALVRMLTSETDHSIHNVDSLTYAGNLESLPGLEQNARYTFHQVDICDANGIQRVLTSAQPDAIIHLAAESHVDRSIDGPAAFVTTNVMGTFNMLQQTLVYWRGLAESKRQRFRFVHVSTDEVYGTLGSVGAFTEETAYAPNSPYAASKAGSDHLARAWYHTYGLPVITTNCSNNYGPYQFPEKLIPLMIQRALTGGRMPVYGRGENVRDWLFVEDHCRALTMVLERGLPGETYNVGGSNERRNIDVVTAIAGLIDSLSPDAAIGPRSELIDFVDDRPGHDLRYAIDATKIREQLGWSPGETFDTGIRKTVEWYLANQQWCARVQSGAYRGERLGLEVKS